MVIAVIAAGDYLPLKLLYQGVPSPNCISRWLGCVALWKSSVQWEPYIDIVPFVIDKREQMKLDSASSAAAIFDIISVAKQLMPFYYFREVKIFSCQQLHFNCKQNLAITAKEKYDNYKLMALNPFTATSALFFNVYQPEIIQLPLGLLITCNPSSTLTWLSGTNFNYFFTSWAYHCWKLVFHWYIIEMSNGCSLSVIIVN